MLSIFFLLGILKVLQLFLSNLAGSLELAFVLKRVLPLLLKPHLLSTRVLFGGTHLLVVALLNLSFEVLLETRLIDSMMRLDRKDFKHKGEFGFSQELVFFCKVAAVCVIVVGDFTECVFDLLEAV